MGYYTQLDDSSNLWHEDEGYRMNIIVEDKNVLTNYIWIHNLKCVEVGGGTDEGEAAEFACLGLQFDKSGNTTEVYRKHSNYHIGSIGRGDMTD